MARRCLECSLAKKFGDYLGQTRCRVKPGMKDG